MARTTPGPSGVTGILAGGSTDLARWIPVAQLPGMERTVLIDTALELERAQPPGGHVEPVPVGGLLRH